MQAQQRMQDIEHEVAVIGAGISGLASAHALHRAGRDVVVLERSGSAGGRIHSERRDGFLVEHGPNSMVAPAPAAEQLIGSLGLGAQRIERGEQVRNRYLVRDGRARALPIHPLRFFASSFFSLPGRLRLLAEPFIAALPGDEAVAGFVRRRFGDELARYVFDPLVGGLYAGDPENLSIEALFPHLKRLEREHGSVMRGAWAARRAGKRGFDPRARALFSFQGGMATLPQAIVAALPQRVFCGCAVEYIEPLAAGFRLTVRRHEPAGPPPGRTPECAASRGPDQQTSTLRARAVVIATPAYAAARLLEPLDATVAVALGSIAHPPLAVVALAYPRDAIAHPLDGLGLLAPKVEQRGVLGLIFSSTLFAGRAPEGHVLLTAYVGGARQPALAQLARDDLVALVHDEVRELLGAKAGARPVFTSVRYWRRSLPQPDLGHGQRMAGLDAFQQRWPGLVLTGNYTGGVSTAACIASGEAAARRVVEHLGAEVPEARRAAGVPRRISA
ncbi:MAG: protoporphyrinogen oxidase [Burkholderiales bacterium]|nr:protoporphyrinogen oxidase [Burkholderiales bacterium]